jgi:hypothetical protein
MKKTKLIVAAAWISLCVYSLIVFLQKSGEVSSEVSIALFIKMLILSFPTGYVGALATEYFLDLFDLGKIDRTIIVWFAMLMAGYIQWFLVLPALLRKIKNRNSLESKGSNQRGQSN